MGPFPTEAHNLKFITRLCLCRTVKSYVFCNEDMPLNGCKLAVWWRIYCSIQYIVHIISLLEQKTSYVHLTSPFQHLGLFSNLTTPVEL